MMLDLSCGDESSTKDCFISESLLWPWNVFQPVLNLRLHENARFKLWAFLLLPSQKNQRVPKSFFCPFLVISRGERTAEWRADIFSLSCWKNCPSRLKCLITVRLCLDVVHCFIDVILTTLWALQMFATTLIRYIVCWLHYAWMNMFW